MKNKSLNSDIEIDLVRLIKTIWDWKIKIFLITVIFVIISFGYNLSQLQPISKQETNQYDNQLVIKSTDDSQFYKFKQIYGYLNAEKYQLLVSDQYLPQTKLLPINSEQVLDIFIKELLDYEELFFVLKNNTTIYEKISNLTDEEQTKSLYDYTKLFSIKKPTEKLNKKFDNYIISFIWEDPEEARKIIDQTVKLVIISVKKSIFNGLEDMLEVKKNNILFEDAKRIEFLLEQSLIAKELNFENDYFGNAVSSSNQYKLSLNINSNIAYYLRGYKAIDKEIEIIKNRQHKGLSDLKNQLNLLKKSDIELVKYNIFLLDSKLIPKPKKTIKNLPLHLAIVFGLIIGIIYIYIANVYRSVKSSKS